MVWLLASTAYQWWQRVLSCLSVVAASGHEIYYLDTKIDKVWARCGGGPGGRSAGEITLLCLSVCLAYALTTKMTICGPAAYSNYPFNACTCSLNSAQGSAVCQFFFQWSGNWVFVGGGGSLCSLFWDKGSIRHAQACCPHLLHGRVCCDY